MLKTNACIKPTNISRTINGKDAKKGTKKATIVKSTSPAKIFPKSRKEKDKILENSDNISNIPKKKLIGLVKLINFFT